MTLRWESPVRNWGGRFGYQDCQFCTIVRKFERPDTTESASLPAVGCELRSIIDLKKKHHVTARPLKVNGDWLLDSVK